MWGKCTFLFSNSPPTRERLGGVTPTELPGILEPCVLPADPALPPHLTHLFLGAPQGSWGPNQPQSLPSSLCHSALICPLLPTGSWEWIGVSLHHGGGELLREEHTHISRRPSRTWPKSALGKHMLS